VAFEGGEWLRRAVLAHLRTDGGDRGGEHHSFDICLREPSGLELGARDVNDRAEDGNQP
jgi:hypothetical protein